MKARRVSTPKAPERGGQDDLTMVVGYDEQGRVNESLWWMLLRIDPARPARSDGGRDGSDRRSSCNRDDPGHESRL